MTIRQEIELTVLTCTCGISHAVPELWRKERQLDHRTWYCPNGCSRHYPQESELDAALRQAKERQAALNEANHLRLVAERARDAAIAEKKRLESRISGGVCPCCNRTFQNVARHMKSKHKSEIGVGKPVLAIAGGK